MLLYHGSNMVIEEIDLTKSRPNKDFGKAFYLSADRKQAEEMAKFKVLTSGGEQIVTVFEFDELHLKDLSIKRFESYSEEWAEFVYNNRDEKQDFRHDYDLVYGPIANDTVGVQIRDLRERKISMKRFSKNSNIIKVSHFNMPFALHWPLQN